MNNIKKRCKNIGIFAFALMVISFIVITINLSLSIAITSLLPVAFVCFQFWLSACISLEISIFFIKKIKISRNNYKEQKELLLGMYKNSRY